MAKAAWLTVEPMSGSGNGSIANTGTVHTGREQRSTDVTGTAIGVVGNKTYKVIQKAKPEFVSFTNEIVTVGKEGGTITVTGKSNSSKLTFSLVEVSDDTETNNIVEGGLSLVLPENYSANGASTANGVEITGDPGASSEYDFNVVFTGIPANNSIDKLTASLQVIAEGGQSSQVTIEQANGDAYFRFDTETITLEASGEPVSVGIESNTSWTLA